MVQHGPTTIVLPIVIVIIIVIVRRMMLGLIRLVIFLRTLPPRRRRAAAPAKADNCRRGRRLDTALDNFSMRRPTGSRFSRQAHLTDTHEHELWNARRFHVSYSLTVWLSYSLTLDTFSLCYSLTLLRSYSLILFLSYSLTKTLGDPRRGRG